MPVSITAEPDFNTLVLSLNGFNENLIAGFNWGSMAQLIADAAEEVFITQGYGRWEPLSEDYARWKARNFPGRGILEREGTYRDAATRIGAPFNFLEIGDDYVEYGVDGLEYPIYHEEGTERLPQRQVFGLLEDSPEFLRDACELFNEWVEQHIRESGLA